MSNFTWDKSLSVGNLAIDSGHQNLIGIINSIDYAIKNPNTADLLRVLGRFYDFANLHFKEEEQIMLSINFTFVAHRQEHQDLLEDLQKNMTRLSLNTHTESGLKHYPDFLNDWLNQHIEVASSSLKQVLSSYAYNFMPA